MEKQSNIDKYFQAARKMPLGVSVDKVEASIISYGLVTSKNSLWTTKNLTIMITSIITTSAIVISLLTTNTAPVKADKLGIVEDTKVEIIKEIEVPITEENETLVVAEDSAIAEKQPIELETIETDPIQTVAIIVTPEKKSLEKVSSLPKETPTTNDTKNTVDIKKVVDFVPVEIQIKKKKISNNSKTRGNGKINGSGNITKTTREVGSFHAINVSSVIEVILTQSDNEKVEVETDDNLQEHFITEVKKGVLYLKLDNKVNDITKAKVYLSIKKLDNITTSGASGVTGRGEINVETLSLDVSGASNINLNLIATKIIFDISEAAHLRFKGKANSCEIDASGASTIKGFDLEVTNCTVNASEASTIKLNITEELTVKASGASNVIYSGSPKIIEKDISDAASVEKK